MTELQSSHVGYEILKNNPMSKRKMTEMRKLFFSRKQRWTANPFDLLCCGLHLMAFSLYEKRLGFSMVKYLSKKLRYDLAYQIICEVFTVKKRPLYCTTRETITAFVVQVFGKYSHTASKLNPMQIKEIHVKLHNLLPVNYRWYIASLLISIDIKCQEHLVDFLYKCSQRIEHDDMWKLYSIGLYVSEHTLKKITLSDNPLNDRLTSNYINYFIEHCIPDYYNNCEEQIALFNAQFEQNKDSFNNAIRIRHFLLEIGKLLLSVEKSTEEKS